MASRPRKTETSIPSRIAAFQSMLKEKNFFAWIIPSTDPHMSEYVAGRWKTRAWASGFAGSAGTLVITRGSAALWTDGRYFLEAAEVLKDIGIGLMKQGLPDTPDIETWIASAADTNADSGGSGSAGSSGISGSSGSGGSQGSSSLRGRVGIDGSICSLQFFQATEARLVAFGLELVAAEDPVDALWADRPALPAEPVYDFPVELSGESRTARLGRLAERSRRAGADGVLVSALDEIAWLLNLRGSDVESNPVFYAYLLVKGNEARLFTRTDRIPDELKTELSGASVSLSEYDELADYLAGDAGRIAADPSTLNMMCAGLLKERLYSWDSPVKLWKAVKNSVELEHTRRVMEKDGVAMVRFLHWLERAVKEGEALSELQISREIRRFRSEQEGFITESFRSIVGFREHGAVVHYSVDEESSLPVEGNGVLLLDSGGQYRDGTTDITRTLAVHEVPSVVKSHYTLVLKGHIGLARALFPKGTLGIQLDTLARQPLWEQGLNYGHGTGHGVGYALNVHEGPMSISTRLVPVALLPGMICSNEPGYYEEGSHGIRIENLVAVEEHPENPGWLRFETLTLCPIDLGLVDKSMLTQEELNWINAYHETVWRRLSPHLDTEHKSWLQHKTRRL